ncbi:hypothetical protein [Shinella sp.]|uniref:hypothetical protein n=1 Tax=unclassified Shinella TaxID=2643062 RepID=UPI0028A589B6|nr:hypothetical protein [Shinella sp.]
MTKRFDELYIPRDEHREVVSFYKKVVVHLYRKLQEMKDDTSERVPCSDAKDDPSAQQAKPQPEFCNVVRINFGPRRPA